MINRCQRECFLSSTGRRLSRFPFCSFIVSLFLRLVLSRVSRFYAFCAYAVLNFSSFLRDFIYSLVMMCLARRRSQPGNSCHSIFTGFHSGNFPCLSSFLLLGVDTLVLHQRLYRNRGFGCILFFVDVAHYRSWFMMFQVFG